jgi:orotidine-5'-phosphate decarboxylase
MLTYIFYSVILEIRGKMIVLSQKNKEKRKMEIRNRIILASDLSSLKKALDLVEELNPYISCFEVGVKLGASVGLPRAIRALKAKRVEVFADVKLLDIRTHVADAVRSLTKLGADIITLSCFGGPEMLKAAAKAAVNEANLRRIPCPLLFGVGPLTSQDYGDLVEIGIAPRLNIPDTEKLIEAQNDFLRRLTQRLALLSQENGLDGFITPGDQIETVRECCGPDFQILTPGVRPSWAPLGPHKRSITAFEAIKATADRIIIGDSVMNPPAKIGSPVAAVEKISEEIERALKERGY